MIPYILYVIGSCCFLVGSTIALVQKLLAR